MQRVIIFIYLGIVTALVACGGGGGGGSDESFFGGIWRGTLSVISNSCSFVQPPLTLTQTVNQLGQQVVMESDLDVDAPTFTGFTTGDNSFLVTSEVTRECNFTSAPTLLSITYMNIEDDMATVLFSADSSGCRGNEVATACELIMRGVFVRQQLGLENARRFALGNN